MALARWRPMEKDWMTETDRMLENMRRFWRSEPIAGAGWTPEVNLFEKDDQLILEADLPGVEKSQIHVEVSDNTLTLRGERQIDEGVKDQDYLCCERSKGPFTRVLTLPTSVDVKKIDASFNNGVLTVKLPKTAEAKAKQIAIH